MSWSALSKVYAGLVLLLTGCRLSANAQSTNHCGVESIYLTPSRPYQLRITGDDVTTSLQCHWTIQAAPGTKIRLTIRDLLIYDYRDILSIVNIPAERNQTSRYILRYQKKVKVQEVMSSGHVVTVKFSLSSHFSDHIQSTSRRFLMDIQQVPAYESLLTSCNKDKGLFLCDSQDVCVDQSALCDVIMDCPDQSDERGCPLNCTSSELCSNTSACLLPRMHCDGIADCDAAEDEENCAERFCPEDCSCQMVDEALIVNCSRHPDLVQVWAKLPRITAKLILKRNDIAQLPIGRFLELPKLLHIVLEDNKLTRLQRGLFDGLHSLELLKVNKNKLVVIDAGVFQPLKSLTVLRLDDNNLAELTPEMFQGLDGLINLRLGRNRIRNLRADTFQNLTNLVGLDLIENNISAIDRFAFRGLSSLRSLEIRQNSLAVIEKQRFISLESLRILDMRGNPWTVIQPGAFRGLDKLLVLVLERYSPDDMKDFTVDIHEIEHLTILVHLVVDDARMCCLLDYKSNGIKDACVLRGTSSSVSLPYFTCDRLMHNSVLRAFIWLLGVSALIGNTFIIIWRLRKTDPGKRSQSVLILNLAVSDLLMGIYMLIIAAADAHFQENFFLHSERWRSGALCKLAGFISMLSCEASVFFITMISIDRFQCVVFPFGKKWFRFDSARGTSLCMWSVALLISFPPLLLQDKIDGFYGLHDVCVALPLKTPNHSSDLRVDLAELGVTVSPWKGNLTVSATPSRIFSVSVYLGLNLVCCLVVLMSYMAIAFVVLVKVPSKKLHKRKDKEHRRREMEMARRMLLIVGTDFCCWMPVIMMGILSMGGQVQISNEVYAWVVVFIIPINSAINPYLYTFSNSTLSLNCCNKLRHSSSPANSVKMKALTSHDNTSQRCRSGTHTLL